MLRQNNLAAKLENAGEGPLAVRGDLDFHSVTAIWNEILKLPSEPSGQTRLEVDLANVQRADSSGVALLIEWLRLAQTNRQQIRFVNTPEQMRAIIRVAELDRLLPLA
jgi:phospholipid transport system transporter-binding protein